MAASIIADKSQPLTVLMLAAEHGGLSGAKVGGMADVIAGIVPALAAQGVNADVVMPDYGFLAQKLGCDEPVWFEVPFRDGAERLALYRGETPQGSRVLLLAHPLWQSSPGKLYIQSPDGRPFADDADRFALFGAAVAEALRQGLIPLPDRFHLHDWHQGFFALLRAADYRYRALQAIPAVLSIHNLALQGIRPMTQESSSLAAWYPWLREDDLPEWARDSRFGHCFNPLRTAINGSQRLHLVSPNYCNEVLQPSDPGRGFVGGEGLEADLQRFEDLGKLVGILNGCDYPPSGLTVEPNSCSVLRLQRAALRALARAQAQPQAGGDGRQDLLATLRLMDWQLSLQRPDGVNTIKDEPFLLTSVGRLTDQKVGLLRRSLDGKSVLAHLLERLARFQAEARFIMLGSGDPAIEDEFHQLSAQHDNFIFINHFDLELSAELYRCGQLFLMPSSFEPCGISQMLAMREGQPCLVSSVGGLVDTVKDRENGWRFGGNSADEQARHLLDVFESLLGQYGSEHWLQVKQAAAASRFEWRDAARSYLEHLYRT